MNKLIDVNAYPIIDVLPILLKDKSTKQNIIWATDAYTYRGTGYNDTDQMLENQFTGINALQLQPRISKSLEEQQDRTRKKAEVMTPVWLCNKMNNFADEQWFGRKDVFNHENEDNTRNFLNRHKEMRLIEERQIVPVNGENDGFYYALVKKG